MEIKILPRHSTKSSPRLCGEIMSTFRLTNSETPSISIGTLQSFLSIKLADTPDSGAELLASNSVDFKHKKNHREHPIFLSCLYPEILKPQ